MAWLEQAVRRYEHRRWTTDDNRRVLPFAWGLEHIDGPANADDAEDPREFLDSWVERTLAHSDQWYAVTPSSDPRLHPAEGAGRGQVLTFTSQVHSPWPENNLVHARFFAARKTGPAVVVLPQWNAKWDSQVN